MVQAYSFTSTPIAKALVNAKQRGVSVRVILDKSQYRTNRYSSSTYFVHQDIPVWIDNEVAIAHNKVMIIDDDVLVTGSFNFTKAAQERNAENLLIIWNSELVNQYRQNWYHRLQVSKSLSDYEVLASEKRKRNQYPKKTKNKLAKIAGILTEFSQP